MKRALTLMVLLLTANASADPPDAGATVSVTVDANGDTTVDVQKGTLKGKPLKRALAAPAAVSPLDGATLGMIDVPLVWRAVPGAARYVVEIASQPEMVAARTETVEGTRATVHFAAGTWYWRVVALDGGGAAGRHATARRLNIDTTPQNVQR